MISPSDHTARVLRLRAARVMLERAALRIASVWGERTATAAQRDDSLSALAGAAWEFAHATDALDAGLASARHGEARPGMAGHDTARQEASASQQGGVDDE